MQIEYLWEALPANQKYKYYDEFEKSYLALLFSKTDKIDIIWTSVNLTNSYLYTFDKDFEHEFFNLAYPNIRGFDEIWMFILLNHSYGVYTTDDQFEAENINMEIDNCFNYYSSSGGGCKYRTDACLENFFKDVDAEICENMKKTGKRVTVHKSNNLKKLLDIRQKRLKLMSEHVETIKSNFCATVLYLCRVCDVL